MVSDRTKLLLGAGGVAVGVGIAHFGTHNAVGDPSVFDQAGVSQAGLASAAVAGVGAGLLASQV